MAIELPNSAVEIDERSKTDVQRDLIDSDPFLKNSVLGAAVTANANRVFDFYGQLDILQTILMPDTSVDEFLERWAAIYGLQRLAATKASGSIISGGTVISSIIIGTLYTASGGEIYETTSTIAISSKNISVLSINRSGTIVTVVCNDPHEMAVNILFDISGADQPEYNVTSQQILSVIDADTFTFDITSTPITPATGTITLLHDSAVVPVESQNFQNTDENINVNLASGSILSLQSPIVGIDNDAGVGAAPISGGTDREENKQLSARLLNRIQKPTAHFNSADIENKAREVPGVTRVFVQEVTPAIGQVTIYFMRDNDDDPTPDVGEIATVKDKILTIKPANTATVDVIVLAPTPVVVAFTFSSLTPNTISMQNAVTANLEQFFAEETEVGINIQEDAYRAAIQNTIDTETGNTVSDFVLSTPTGDIAIGAGSIGALGVITYP